MHIEDGKGKGLTAEVTSTNRLLVESLSKSSLAVRSELGEALGITTPHLPITATSGRMLWIYNSSTSLYFHMDKIWFNWNGGDTNHNRICRGIMLFGDITSLPSANETEGGAGNLNSGSSKSFDLDVYYWDEGGSGMTSGAMVGAFYFQVPQGSSVFSLDSSVILAPKKALGFDLQGEEVGLASINIIGAMVD